MTSQADMTGILLDPEEISFRLILLLALVATVLVLLVQRGVPWIADRLPGRFRNHLLPLVPVLRLLILTVALLQIAPLVIRPTPENLLVLLGTGAVAVGFAFKDYLAGLIAGVVAVYERPYRVGDRIAVGSAYGEVRRIGLRALKLVTADDTTVTIPHSRIWTEAVWNANDGSREQLCVADFYLHPEHDAARVRQRLLDVAWSSPYLHASRPVEVSVKEELRGTHYRVKAYPIDGRDEFAFVSDLTVRGKTALAEMGARPAAGPGRGGGGGDGGPGEERGGEV